MKWTRTVLKAVLFGSSLALSGIGASLEGHPGVDAGESAFGRVRDGRSTMRHLIIVVLALLPACGCGKGAKPGDGGAKPLEVTAVTVGARTCP